MKSLRSILAATACIIIVFVAVSLLDIIISVLYSRFYSSLAFIVTFGIGGIFAAVLSYMYGVQEDVESNSLLRWILVSFLIVCGLIIFFLLAKLEGGEYEPAFKAYGATLALGSLLFAFGKGK